MTLAHVSVNFSRCAAAMSQERLNVPQICSTFQQVCCKAVAQIMKPQRLIYPCQSSCIFKNTSQTLR